MKKKNIILICIFLFFFFICCVDSTKTGVIPLPEYNEDISKINIIIQTSHKDGITAVAFSPDGNYVVSGSFDKTIKLWNREGNLIKTFIRPPRAISALAFSPDSTMIVAGSDESIELWSINGIKITSFKAHSNYISAVLFSPEGNQIISGSWDKSVKIWDLEGTIIMSFPLHAKIVNCIAISPDGTTIASGSDDKSIRFRDFKGNLLHSIRNDTHEIKTIAYSPSGEYIIAGTDDGKLLLYRTDGIFVRTIDAHADIVGAVMFMNDSKRIISSSWKGKIRVWDLSGKLLKTFDMGHVYYERFALSPDETIIVSGSNEQAMTFRNLNGDFKKRVEDRTYTVFGTRLDKDASHILNIIGKKGLQVWDITGRTNLSYPLKETNYYRLAVSPDGKYYAALFVNNTIKLMERTGKVIQTFIGHTIEKIQFRFSSNSEFLILHSVKWGVRFWKIDGSIETTFSGTTNLYNMIEISPDGNYFISGDKNEMKLWTIKGNLVRTFKGHTGVVTVAAFSTNNRYIISGSNDNSLKLWDIKGKLIRTFTGYSHGINQVEISNNGKYILSQEQNATIKLRTINGKRICEFANGYFLPYNNPAFSPDSRKILLKADKGPVLFSIKGELITSFSDHPHPVNTIRFSLDGKYICAAYLDGIVKIWETESLKSISLLTFTSGEWFVFNDENKYDCSKGAEQYIFFRKGLELHDSAQMRKDFYIDNLLVHYLN